MKRFRPYGSSSARKMRSYKNYDNQGISDLLRSTSNPDNEGPQYQYVWYDLPLEQARLVEHGISGTHGYAFTDCNLMMKELLDDVPFDAHRVMVWHNLTRAQRILVKNTFDSNSHLAFYSSRERRFGPFKYATLVDMSENGNTLASTIANTLSIGAEDKSGERNKIEPKTVEDIISKRYIDEKFSHSKWL